MQQISKIDKNFIVKTKIERENIRFFDAESSPFKIYGLIKENDKFRRFPEGIAKSVSEGVHALHANTAGGRVRFITDSDYVAINAKMENICKMPHFSLTGGAGFDMYAKEDDSFLYAGTFIPPYDITEGFESVIDFEDRKKRIIEINFPLYSDVISLHIGLRNGCMLEEAPGYTIKIPIVYYGSSITQGGCASKPGSSYQSIISRKFDCDYINLGFSGNAKGEKEITDYIKSLPMSVFVLDYDHNAPTAEHLKNTHEKMFKAIRQANPTLPIVIMSRPKYYLTKDEKERLAIITKTYDNAKLSGDKNVYLLTGPELMGELIKDNGTVDNCHPTDGGFLFMAEALGKVIEQILSVQK